MFCPNCGSKNEEGSLFCLQCGAKLDGGNEAAPAASAPAQPAQPAAQPEQPAQPASQPAAQPAAQPAQAPAQQTPPPPQQNQPTAENSWAGQTVVQQPVQPAGGQVPPQQQVPAQEGCIGAAWHDITSTQGWFKKSLLLGLVHSVPFLGLAATGYAEQWGIDVAKGKREVMPKKILNNRNFITGIFELIAWVIYGLIAFAAQVATNAVFSFIPVLPILIGIAWIVFGLFYHGYISLASMRSALKMDFGSGYETKILFDSFKKKPGSLFGAYFIPSIICKAIIVVLVLICAGIFVAALIPATMGIANSLTSMSSSSDITKMLGGAGAAISGIMSLAGMIMGFLGLMVVVIFIVILLLTGFEKLWRYRAIGHWIARFAPEWVTPEDLEIKYLKL